MIRLNPDSVWPPVTDNGTMLPFKYSFDLSHKEIDSGGWTRQVTVRDLAISKTMAGRGDAADGGRCPRTALARVG